jgi:hypothetical protein
VADAAADFATTPALNTFKPQQEQPQVGTHAPEAVPADSVVSVVPLASDDTEVIPVGHHSQAQTFTGYLKGFGKGSNNKFAAAAETGTELDEACCSVPFLKFYASGKNMTGKELAQLVASGGEETGELCCDKLILKLLGKVIHELVNENKTNPFYACTPESRTFLCG